MFYYGQYMDDRMKTRTGIEFPVSEFEAGAMKRGMSYIAFSQVNLPQLMGWRYYICGSDIETLMSECNRFWTMKTGSIRGYWEMRRLDKKDLMLMDTSGRKPRECWGTQLTF